MDYIDFNILDLGPVNLENEITKYNGTGILLIHYPVSL